MKDDISGISDRAYSYVQYRNETDPENGGRNGQTGYYDEKTGTMEYVMRLSGTGKYLIDGFNSISDLAGNSTEHKLKDPIRVEIIPKKKSN